MNNNDRNVNINNENAIEFIRGQRIMTVTFSQRRFVTKVKKMAEKYPDQVKIVCENEDGSIIAHMPVKALHLYLTKGRKFTEEEREKMKDRMIKYHNKGNEESLEDDDLEDDDFDDDFDDMD